jgi:hypothetical protein
MTKVVFPNVVAPKRSIPCHQAPIEGKTKVYPYRFLGTIASFIENGDPSLFESYTTLQIGKQGVLCFSYSGYKDLSVILWSRQLDLRRGRTALLVPSREGENLILSAFAPDCRKHLGTFYYDREAKSFYALTGKSNSTSKEYFVRVDANRRFVFRNALYDLSAVAEKGDIVRLVEQGEKVLYRTTCDLTWKPLAPALPLSSTQHHKESNPDRLEKDRFSEKDRQTIDTKPVKTEETALPQNKQAIEAAIERIIIGYSKSLNTIISELVTYFSEETVSTEDIAHAITFIHKLAMDEDQRFSHNALQVFANMHKVLYGISEDKRPKLGEALSLMIRSEETKSAVLLIIRNGLKGEKPDAIRELIKSNQYLLANLRK